MAKGIYVPANSTIPPEEREITTLRDDQLVVDGLIEAVDIPHLGVTIYVEEGGPLMQLGFNHRAIIF